MRWSLAFSTVSLLSANFVPTRPFVTRPFRVFSLLFVEMRRVLSAYPAINITLPSFAPLCRVGDADGLAEAGAAELPSQAGYAGRVCYNSGIMAGGSKKKVDATKRNLTILNRKASHEYEIDERFVAGLVLTGTEIKSIRLGLCNLQDSFCRVQSGEVWVYNMYIAPYEMGNRYNVEPRRARKLLLHKWQIVRMTGKINERGMALVPTKLFFERGYAKLEIGLGKGKKLWDKRESIASRDREREARREVFTRE